MHKDTDYSSPPGRRIGALALIRDESGAVLMVKPSYKDGHQLPGGAAHADEFPHVACAREVTEETRLTDFEPGRLLVVDYVPRNEKTGTAEGINFVYDGGTIPNGTEITLPDAASGEEPELNGYMFVPLYALGEFALPYQERRIRSAIAVLEDDRHSAYLVEGRPVTANAR